MAAKHLGKKHPFVTLSKPSLFGNSKYSFNIYKNTNTNTDTNTNTKEDNNSPDYQLITHHAKFMLITCMDFRLIDDVVDALDIKGYRNEYDEFIIAGASLGYNTSLGFDSNGIQNTPLIETTSWTNVANTHIDLAIKLHEITQVIIIDHLDCGAYKAWYENKISTSNEIALHTDNLNKTRDLLKIRYPELSVRLFIMDLTGKLTEIM